jgi:hypothetical protein
MKKKLFIFLAIIIFYVACVIWITQGVELTPRIKAVICVGGISFLCFATGFSGITEN